MKKIKLKYKNGYIDNIEDGTTLLEISERIKDDFKYQIVGARINYDITGLNTKVSESGKVEFYDISSKIGNRIYSRSLEYLTTLAAKRTLGTDTDVMINYSIDNAIHCEIIGKTITSATVNKIEEEMRNLVSKNILFQNVIVDRIEAIK